MQPEGKGKTVLAWEEHLEGGMSTTLGSEKSKRVAVVRICLFSASPVHDLDLLLRHLTPSRIYMHQLICHHMLYL